MAQIHSQARCRTCQKLTMHVADQEEVPHATYALMSLFCCLIFVPIWIVHAITSWYHNNHVPWRCSVCGTPWRR